MLLYYGTEEVDGNTLMSGSHMKKNRARGCKYKKLAKYPYVVVYKHT